MSTPTATARSAASSGSPEAAAAGGGIDNVETRTFTFRDFPLQCGKLLAEVVHAQRRLLDHLGVKHLVAVAGPSFGGYQAFQWAVTFPDFMDGIVAVVTAPKGGGGERAVQDLVAQLAKHPNWNGGFYYDKGGIRSAMVEFRVATLKRYGIEQQLMERYSDSTARESAIRRLAEP